MYFSAIILEVDVISDTEILMKTSFSRCRPCTPDIYKNMHRLDVYLDRSNEFAESFIKHGGGTKIQFYAKDVQMDELNPCNFIAREVKWVTIISRSPDWRHEDKIKKLLIKKQKKDKK